MTQSRKPAAAEAPAPPVVGSGRRASSKLQSHHLERSAIVYGRQSTPQQVLEHRESAARQYALTDLAVEFGWPAGRIEVIDEDQGQSGSTIEGRAGFHRLLAEVGLDHVGIVLGLELSRLARSNKDWSQLIELCAIFRTLLADQDGLYDPTDDNDRLLLGLRGIMNEAELHVLQGRMHEALLNKARRGEVYLRPPAGYIKLSAGGFALDPDEQARGVIRLIFEEFERQGSVRGVLRVFQRHEIKLPIRPHCGSNQGQLEWRHSTPSVVYRVLTHPLYAGIYRFGHRQTDPRRRKAGHPDAGRVVVPPEKCHALIPHHCPAYISAEQYERNQQRIHDNRFRRETKGAAREGKALLGGILFCGKCGRRMTVYYPGVRKLPRYQCTTGIDNFRAPRCQNISGQVVDELVIENLLKALEPAALELSLLAAENLQQERCQLEEHWKQRLERSRYHVERARRQFDAVEPENRLVARELERQWEAALREFQELEQQHARLLLASPATLTDDQRELIRSLSNTLPAVWQAPTTTNGDRQRIVRLLLDRAVVTVVGTTEQVKATLHWSGGYTSHHELVRPVRRYEQTANYERLKSRLIELEKQGMSYAQIADQLNREGFRPTKQVKKFEKSIVGRLLQKVRGNRAPAREFTGCVVLQENEWYANDLAATLGIPRSTLQSWQTRGWVHVSRTITTKPGRIVYWADEHELDRLRQLRRTKHHFGDPPLPKTLTTPKIPATK